MAKQITTSILIHATPKQVWAVFTDFKSYPQWNPFVRSINGAIQTGQKLTVQLQSSPTSVITMKPRLLVFEANCELRWMGHLLFTGLFDGEHKFELVDNGNGTTTFIQSEKFNGILVPLFKKMLDGNTTNGFKAFNQKLKERVERVER